MKRRRSSQERRRGSAVVETAFILPILVLFVFGLVEYGRYFMTSHMITNAAREGAKYAAAHTSAIYLDGSNYGNATTDVVNVVNARIGSQQLTSQTVNVFLSDSLGNNLGTWTSAAAGQYVCVQITGTYTFYAPTLLGLPSTLTLTRNAVRRSEGN